MEHIDLLQLCADKIVTHFFLIFAVLVLLYDVILNVVSNC